MSDAEDNDDKPYEASQKKLDDARRKGEVPQSKDTITAAAYGGLLLVALAVGGGSLAALGTQLMVLLGRADTLAPLMLEPGGQAVAGALMLSVAGTILPWFLLPALAALVAVVAQRSLVFAPEKVAPKISRLSLLSNAKNKYGRNGLFEFAKSAAKLLVYSVLLAVFLKGQFPEIVATLHLSPAMAASQLASLVVEFIVIVVLIAAAIGAVDFFWQQQEHARKHRMSHKEMQDEAKESQGDPQLKQERRQKGYDIATNNMLQDVPEADVVIVNPRHYAVALRWDRGRARAPVCVAKGVDEISKRIRETAMASGVPIHRDPPTARGLHAAIEIGSEVPPDQYRAVAAAIRFAETMRSKARSWP